MASIKFFWLLLSLFQPHLKVILSIGDVDLRLEVVLHRAGFTSSRFPGTVWGMFVDAERYDDFFRIEPGSD